MFAKLSPRTAEDRKKKIAVANIINRLSIRPLSTWDLDFLEDMVTHFDNYDNGEYYVAGYF